MPRRKIGEVFSFRLGKELHEALEMYSMEHKTDKTKLVRKLVEQFLFNEAKKLKERKKKEEEMLSCVVLSSICSSSFMTWYA